ncbi:MAG: twin-arginine translocation signal domain-containing protein, partial [Chloroflexota bacterium]
MRAHRRGFLRGLAAATAAAVVPDLYASPPAWAAGADADSRSRRLAAGQPAADWVHLGPDGPAARLFTPASGALFVTAGGGLQRSDDAGATWTPVSLPPRPDNAAVEVDPTNHQTVYAATSDGLQCTDDGG